MWMEHLRAWFLGQPVRPEAPAKPREQRDAQRAAAACAPKPLAEAVGDALSAVGELVAAIQVAKKGSKKKGGGKKGRGKKGASRSASRASSSSSSRRSARRAPVGTREVVVVDEVVVEPRGSRRASRGRTTRRASRATIAADTPIIVAADRPTTPPEGDASESA
jgi:hypothetical protein